MYYNKYLYVKHTNLKQRLTDKKNKTMNYHRFAYNK